MSGIINKEMIQLAESAITSALDTSLAANQRYLIQRWADGWLIHIYAAEKMGPEKHVTTVGGPDLYSAIIKLREYNSATN